MISNDFNGDNRADIAVVNGCLDSVMLYLGTGTGNFGTVANFLSGGVPTNLISADFNNDGRPDLATANSASANVSILLNCTPTATCAVSMSVNSATICAGDSATLTATGASTYYWMPSYNLSSPYGSNVFAKPSSTTTYTVIGNLSSCTPGVATSIVNVNQGPTVTYTLTPNATPHVWDATPSYSGGTPPYSYSWDWGDGTPNSTLAYPSHTYTTAAKYNICVTITDANGCTSIACQNDSVYRLTSNNSIVVINVINNSFGLAGFTNEEIVSIYPNPTSGHFTIRSPEEISAVEIRNIIGEKVYSCNSPLQNTIDLSEKPKGIYFVEVISGGKRIVKKLSVE